MAGRKGKYTAEIVQAVVKLLEGGNTDVDTCGLVGIVPDTFYDWIKHKPDFSDAVTRARSVARDAAVAAWRAGMTPSVETVETTETLTETRFNKTGEPYDYTRTVTKRQIINRPADWKAAEAYLKRRDPLNWSEHTTQDVTSGGQPIQLTWPKPETDDDATDNG